MGGAGWLRRRANAVPRLRAAKCQETATTKLCVAYLEVNDLKTDRYVCKHLPTDDAEVCEVFSRPAACSVSASLARLKENPAIEKYIAKIRLIDKWDPSNTPLGIHSSLWLPSLASRTLRVYSNLLQLLVYNPIRKAAGIAKSFARPRPCYLVTAEPRGLH